MPFRLHSQFQPQGDQPKAIGQLVKNVDSRLKDQVLLGVTGSGKTYTMAAVIEKAKRPVLVISPNKTLAAQLYQEFKEFFPNNAVHYFVSYYDYYQPEAYIPQTNTYIEKDAKVNEVIDRLRHAATQDLLQRRDVIVVASVSCIYNIGSPEDYQEVSLEIKPGKKMSRRDFLLHLAKLQYQRNDIDLKPGTFRVRGDLVEVYLVTGKEIISIEFSSSKIEKVASNRSEVASYRLYPATFWVTPEERLAIAAENIRTELQERLGRLKKEGKLPEAQRLEQRTNYDLEMIKEAGWCHGIENYSRHMEFRKEGSPPYTLLDYFPDDFLVFIDESHLTLSQLKAMSVQDKIRKQTLVNYGFRLKSCIDNRPLTFEEFDQKTPQKIYVSATPSLRERNRAGKHIVEQLIRPTGLLEPAVEIRSTKNQVKDVISEIKKRAGKKQRVLVVTLTKRLAEALAEYLQEAGVKTNFLHSEVKTLARPEILRDFRLGKYDAIVGINLLREGLDLPEVSLVAILDADKEGFLRNETTLIQTMGRAARHQEGSCILYADKMTFSMENAIKEVRRRREIQETYNKANRITPQPIVKEVREWSLAEQSDIDKIAAQDVLSLMELNDAKTLEKEMRKAAKLLDFERAAEIRDLIKRLKNGKLTSNASHPIG